MAEFWCWDSYDEEDDGQTVKGYDAQAAAERYVEINHANHFDYCAEAEVRVRDGEAIRVFHVEVRNEPTFYAAEVKHGPQR